MINLPRVHCYKLNYTSEFFQIIIYSDPKNKLAHEKSMMQESENKKCVMLAIDHVLIIEP